MISKKTLLQVSLAINVLFAISLVVFFTQLSDLKTQGKVLELESAILAKALLEQKEIAQNQTQMATRQKVRANVALQKAIGQAAYTRQKELAQAQKATHESGRAKAVAAEKQ